MPELNATPSADANSYVTVEEARLFWDSDFHKDNTYTNNQIKVAAISATRQLDIEYGADYGGVLYDQSYALFFPRTGLYDSRGVSVTDYSEFPYELKRATAAQAYYILRKDRVSDDVAKLSSVKKQSMDGLGSKEMASINEQKSAARYSVIADEVKSLMKSLVKTPTSPYVSFLGRG